jgi:hypothetical protein
MDRYIYVYMPPRSTSWSPTPAIQPCIVSLTAAKVERVTNPTLSSSAGILSKSRMQALGPV